MDSPNILHCKAIRHKKYTEEQATHFNKNRIPSGPASSVRTYMLGCQSLLFVGAYVTYYLEGEHNGHDTVLSSEYFYHPPEQVARFCLSQGVHVMETTPFEKRCAVIVGQRRELLVLEFRGAIGGPDKGADEIMQNQRNKRGGLFRVRFVGSLKPG